VAARIWAFAVTVGFLRMLLTSAFSLQSLENKAGNYVLPHQQRDLTMTVPVVHSSMRTWQATMQLLNQDHIIRPVFTLEMSQQPDTKAKKQTWSDLQPEHAQQLCSVL
jgi:hypothetical protein